MIRFRSSFVSLLDPPTVFDYLSEFENVAEWDPGIEYAERVTEGPVQVGSRFHLLYRFVGRTGRLDYEVVQLSKPGRIVLEATNRSMHARDTILFEALGAGTRITYAAEIDLKGWLQLAEPVMRRFFARSAHHALHGLESRLMELANEQLRKGA